MAAPAEVSKRHSNFRIRQFQENPHFNIAANLTLNTMVSFVILLVARPARIACVDRQTDRQTELQTKDCNPRCACAPRVNKLEKKYVYEQRSRDTAARKELIQVE